MILHLLTYPYFLNSLNLSGDQLLQRQVGQ